MYQRGLDEAAIPALLLAEGLVEPSFQAKKAARERSRKAAHQAARRAGRRIVEEQLCLEAKPIGVDEVHLARKLPELEYLVIRAFCGSVT